ncbi:MAG TPA: SGNH/GDSL hydrolase family protein [Acidimicrobiales bacterium]
MVFVRRRRLAAIVAVALAAAVALSSCDRDGSSSGSGARPAPQPVVYVAVGASDSVGVGATDPKTQAWPQVFLREALPAGSRLTNVAVSGTRTDRALTEQVPKAVAANPDVVTVWLSVNDLTGLVDAKTYGEQLRQVVHALRRGGDTMVLVGNTPEVDQLPVIRRSGVPAALVEKRVDDYNAAIEEVVRAEGAVLVDLHAKSEKAEADGELAALTAADGFHPSTAGHARIADAFAKAYADAS